MSNVEVRYSVYFLKKIERSETILRNSAVQYSSVLRFAFPFFSLCLSVFVAKIVIFKEVS